jgi:hypothetical protein
VSGPLTIYECPKCDWWFGDDDERGEQPITCADGHDEVALREVRVFREEDVRPLWEIAVAGIAQFDPGRSGRNAVRNFPAPEEWKR